MPRPARVGRSALYAAPVVVFVALAVVAALLGAKAAGFADRADARQAVLQAARDEAVNLTTIAWSTAAHDLDRILAGATGSLRTQFASQRAQFPAVLARDKSVTRGRVVSAGLASLSGGRARVVVATDATVSTTPKGGARQSVVKHYRMVMTLVQVGSRWLVGDVAFAGLPQ